MLCVHSIRDGRLLLAPPLPGAEGAPVSLTRLQPPPTPHQQGCSWGHICLLVAVTLGAEAAPGDPVPQAVLWPVFSAVLRAALMAEHRLFCSLLANRASWLRFPLTTPGAWAVLHGAEPALMRRLKMLSRRTG